MLVLHTDPTTKLKQENKKKSEYISRFNDDDEELKN